MHAVNLPINANTNFGRFVDFVFITLRLLPFYGIQICILFVSGKMKEKKRFLKWVIPSFSDQRLDLAVGRAIMVWLRWRLGTHLLLPVFLKAPRHIPKLAARSNLTKWLQTYFTSASTIESLCQYKDLIKFPPLWVTVIGAKLKGSLPFTESLNF